MAEDLSDLQPVEAEHDGRVLTGVGVTVEELQETMEARSGKATDQPPTDPNAPAGETEQPQRARDGNGQFVRESKGSKRFSELTAEAKAAQSRAEAAEAEAKRLKDALDALQTARETRHDAPGATNGNGAPETTPPVAAAPAASQTATRPEPSVDEIGTKYKTYEDFTRDVARWEIEQERAKWQTETDTRIRLVLDAERQRESFKQTVNSASERGRKAYPDFDQVISASSVDVPWPLLISIGNHPRSEHLQYALAKDPKLASDLVETFTRDPLQAGILLERALGSIASAASPASTARPGLTTNAPAPYQPVGSGTKTTVPNLDQLADQGDDFDASGYRERRAAERARGGARR